MQGTRYGLRPLHATGGNNEKTQAQSNIPETVSGFTWGKRMPSRHHPLISCHPSSGCRKIGAYEAGDQNEHDLGDGDSLLLIAQGAGRSVWNERRYITRTGAIACSDYARSSGAASQSNPDRHTLLPFPDIGGATSSSEIGSSSGFIAHNRRCMLLLDRRHNLAVIQTGQNLVQYSRI